MSARDVSGPFNPSVHQTIHIFVCTKLRFQATLRRIFGEARLAAINASDSTIHPACSVLPDFSRRVYLCADLGREKYKPLNMASFPYFYGRKFENASIF